MNDDGSDSANGEGSRGTGRRAGAGAQQRGASHLSRRVTKAPPPINPIRGGTGAFWRPSVKPIDWAYWRLMPVVPLWVAIALSLEQNPDDLPFDWVGDSFIRRLRLCLSNVDAGLLRLTVHSPDDRRLSLVTAAEFERWADAVGLQLPGDFPRAVVSAEHEIAGQGSQARQAGKELTAARRCRRLQRFRQLGGEVECSGGVWRLIGVHGALADLVREEAAASRQMKDRNDIKKDLFAAAQSEAKHMG